MEAYSFKTSVQDPEAGTSQTSSSTSAQTNDDHDEEDCDAITIE